MRGSSVIERDADARHAAPLGGETSEVRREPEEAVRGRTDAKGHPASSQIGDEPGVFDGAKAVVDTRAEDLDDPTCPLGAARLARMGAGVEPGGGRTGEGRRETLTVRPEPLVAVDSNGHDAGVVRLCHPLDHLLGLGGRLPPLDREAESRRRQPDFLRGPKPRVDRFHRASPAPNQAVRTWRSPYPEGTHQGHARTLASSEEAFDTPLGARRLSATDRGLLPGAPAITRTGPSPAGLVQLAGRNISGRYQRLLSFPRARLG